MSWQRDASHGLIDDAQLDLHSPMCIIRGRPLWLRRLLTSMARDLVSEAIESRLNAVMDAAIIPVCHLATAPYICSDHIASLLTPSHLSCHLCGSSLATSYVIIAPCLLFSPALWIIEHLMPGQSFNWTESPSPSSA